MIIRNNVIFQASKFPGILLCSVSQKMEKHAMPKIPFSNCLYFLFQQNIPKNFRMKFHHKRWKTKFHSPTDVSILSSKDLPKTFPPWNFHPVFSQLWQKPYGEMMFFFEKTSISDVSRTEKIRSSRRSPNKSCLEVLRNGQMSYGWGWWYISRKKNIYIYISVYIYWCISK